MKIYISLPMGGHERTVRRRYDKAYEEVKEMLPNWEISSPINIDDFTDEGINEDREHDWAWYMARDVEDLLRCDAIYMTRGFLLSKGCRTELAIARSLDLKVYYSEDAYDILTYNN